MNKERVKAGKVATIVMIVVAVLLLPILIINLTLIIKGSIDKDTPPDIFGIAPLAVTSGSMEGDNPDSFGKGALIFIKMLDDSEKQNLKENDVVCFKTDGIFVTHRIVSVVSGENGEIVTVVTRGDANNTTDGAIPVENILGICKGSVEGLGNFALFLQTPAGFLVFIGVPVGAFIIYDVVRILLYNKRLEAETAGASDEKSREKDEELRDKDEEIRRLKELLQQQTAAEDSPDTPRQNENGSDT